MKLRLLAAAIAALTLTAGAAMAQTAPAKPAAPKPATSTAAPAVDKNHASYAFGYSLGQDLARSGEPVDIATVVRGLQDAYAKKAPAYTEQQLETAYAGFQRRVQAKIEESFKKALADNQAKSAEFLTKYKAEKGVVTLPSGIMYRVVQPGTGAKPTTASTVGIAFQSYLAAVGVPLSDIQQPAPFKAGEAPIPALKETLPLMQQGSTWEVVLPPGKGLGPDNAKFANQAILMRFQLGSVK